MQRITGFDSLLVVTANTGSCNELRTGAARYIVLTEILSELHWYRMRMFDRYYGAEGSVYRGRRFKGMTKCGD